jgi:hypothetical protein
MEETKNPATLLKQLGDIFDKNETVRVEQHNPNELIYRNMVLHVLKFQKQTLSKMKDKTFCKHINKEINHLLNKIYEKQIRYNYNYECIEGVHTISGRVTRYKAGMHKYQNDLLNFLKEVEKIISEDE